MTYSTTNPPGLMAQGIGGYGPRMWTYKSSDAAATVCGSSYFSNGHALGMKVGDLVAVLNTASTLGTIGYVSNVTTGAGATLLSSFTTT
jgi:lipid-binding SYLF domain-containing protein